MSLDVLYEDNHLLVVAKPPGLLAQAAVAGDDTLVERARAWLKVAHQKPGNVYVGLVHRLDRETSGVVVLAKTSKAAARLSEQFRGDTSGDGITKDYLAVVHGVVARGGRLDDTIVEVGDGAAIASRTAAPGGKRAVLEYEPLATSAALSLVAVRLETGRKHQIRVQLAAVGHPLVGDRRYGRADDRAGDARLIGRVALHAWRLALDHPTQRAVAGGERQRLAFEAPIPDDFQRLCRVSGLALPPGGT